LYRILLRCTHTSTVSSRSSIERRAGITIVVVGDDGDRYRVTVWMIVTMMKMMIMTGRRSSPRKPSLPGAVALF
jgi:hypothetical protein